MIRYYAFWIPLVDKSDLPIICEKLPEHTLRDIPRYEAVILNAKINKTNNKIYLCYRTQSESIPHELVFHNELKTRDGFLIYKIELPDGEKDFFCQELSKRLHQAVYHYFKGFFHKHVFHHYSEDSLLPTYFSETRIEWDENTRRIILKNIVDFYFLKFNGYLDLWEEVFNLACRQILCNENVIKNIKSLEIVVRSARDVFGEILYCNFLLKSFIHEISDSDREAVQNTIRALNDVHEKITFWYGHFMSKISFWDGKSGKKWGIIGVVISTVSILLALWLEMKSVDIELMNERNRIYQDSLMNSLKEYVTNENQSIMQKQDSIDKNLFEINMLLNHNR